MTASKTAIRSEYLGWRSDDKPTILPRNLLRDCSTGYPIARIDGDFSDADQSDSDYPLTNAYDDTRRTLWKLGAASPDVWFLAKFDAQKQANALVIEGAGGLMAADSIRVRVSDTIDGVTGYLNGTVLTALNDTGVDGRMVYLFDDTYAAIYWEIRILGAAATYQAAQVWLAKQVQLPFKSIVPYDEDRKYGEWKDSVSKSGSKTRLKFFGGLARKEFEVWLWSSNVVTALRTAYTDADDFTSPIWWIESPATDESDSAVFGYLDVAELNLPSQVEDDAIWSNAISEDSPLVD